MLGFTLSKINLLIFVVSVFSIILFFIFSFSTILIENIANDYVRIHAQDAFTLVGSPSLCASQIHYLKDSLESNSGNSGRGLYYIMDIKKAEGNEMNKMIFALAPRKTPEQFMAAASFDTEADIKFFDFQELTSNNCDEFNAPACSSINLYDSNILLDPQALLPSNAYVLLKEVVSGETTVYVIPCSNRQGSDCRVLFERAGNKIREEGFNCSYAD